MTIFIRAAFLLSSVLLLLLYPVYAQGPLRQTPAGAGALNINKVNKRAAVSPEQAIKEYEALLRQNPKDPIVLNNLGAMYFLSDRIFEAQSVLRSAAKLAPDSSQIQVNLAIVLNRSLNPGVAIQTLETILDKQPDEFRAREILCELYQQEGRTAELISCFENLKRAGKLKAASAANYGTALIESGRVDQALKLLKWADTTFTENAGVKNALGVALFRKKKLSQAETSLGRALELRPDVPEVRYNLAVVQMANNKRGLVLEQYNYLKTADPELAGRLYKLLFRDKLISVSP